MKLKYSNCLFEVIKVFIKSPLQIKIHVCFPSSIPHFFWLDKRNDTYYHFRSLNKDLPLWQTIWFKGNIEEMFPGKHENE